ncbi:hypothetical protein HD806DRAFT_500438 [Xylariaceae sp. AK1471]|nr:hypothetical protein HD806DRAFT_500438 [Xylariaceae sp. AK1471]
MPDSRAHAHAHAHAHMRSSRRIPPLTDKDIDHEIKLLDREDSMSAQEAASLSAQTIQSANLSVPDQPLGRSESTAPLTQHTSDGGALSIDEEPEAGPSRVPKIQEQPSGEVESSSPENPLGTARDNPQKRFSRFTVNGRVTHGQPTPSKEPETAIDVLFENQRGGFLCGIPLFSSAALGNLDPPPWTNYFHKPSPTDIHTAQVPDPSWEWAWPEWRINHDEQIQTDSDGWEYSFMFSKMFSWHGPKWYNSFVRRRAWIRRRVKIGFGYQAIDEHAMNPSYFTVTAKQQERGPFRTVTELERSQRGSQRSPERSKDVESTPTATEIKTGGDLMATLRRARVDREKLEAVENYIENCTDDLLPLQHCMHEIMSVFIFQESRRTLLARLTELHDDVSSKAHKGKSATTSKAENLAGAIKHADEEVRRLEYWSDIKEMAANGEAVHAVDHQKGWDSRWQGLDKSGAEGVNEDEIP